MTAENTLLADNAGVLAQGLDVLASLDDGLFARPGPLHAKGGIGGHIRHCLDFYTSFLLGLNSGFIDYNIRERDLRVESDIFHAAFRLQQTMESLARLDVRDLDAPLLVRSEGSGNDDMPWGASSVCRELQFLLSHTTHHYALIALLLKLEGIDTPRDFGVAPSTLAHWRSADACAR